MSEVNLLQVTKCWTGVADTVREEVELADRDPVNMAVELSRFAERGGDLESGTAVTPVGRSWW